MSDETLLKLVGIQEGVCGSRPTIIGTRVEVRHVLGWLASGMEPERIAAEYPHISEEQVWACCLYAEKALDPEATAREDLRRFFGILKITEVSDNDREFKPVNINSCRVLLTQELNGILRRLEAWATGLASAA